MTVSDPTHALFSNLSFTGNELPLFEQCQTNAVTAISQWTDATGITTLAAPVSQTGYSSIAEAAAGSTLNGTTLSNKMLMIGLSEYSTAYLNNNGKRLVENAIYYLLGLPAPQHAGLGTETTYNKGCTNYGNAQKRIQNGMIIIIRDGKTYTSLGQRIE